MNTVEWIIAMGMVSGIFFLIKWLEKRWDRIANRCLKCTGFENEVVELDLKEIPGTGVVVPPEPPDWEGDDSHPGYTTAMYIVTYECQICGHKWTKYW